MLFITISLCHHPGVTQKQTAAQRKGLRAQAAAEALAVAPKIKYVNSRFNFNLKSSMISGISYIIINVYVKTNTLADLSKDKQ